MASNSHRGDSLVEERCVRDVAPRSSTDSEGMYTASAAGYVGSASFEVKFLPALTVAAAKPPSYKEEVIALQGQAGEPAWPASRSTATA